ncbi:hypothetical protein BC831DRAFT_448792 [Entophlyctis helioformis]|nr:hypothetical protein BC831DRAFT_448792 [Entophlyctis helioformis]
MRFSKQAASGAASAASAAASRRTASPPSTSTSTSARLLLALVLSSSWCTQLAAAQKCFTLTDSTLLPEYNGYQVFSRLMTAPFSDTPSTTSFESYLLSVEDANAVYQDNFRNAFGCPNWSGLGQRFHLSYFTSLIVYLSSPPSKSACTQPATALPLCRDTCFMSLVALSGIFNDRSQCGAADPSGNRAITLRSYEGYCRTLAVANTTMGSCMPGLGRELAQCGFPNPANAARYCTGATASRDPCCSTVGFDVNFMSPDAIRKANATGSITPAAVAVALAQSAATSPSSGSLSGQSITANGNGSNNIKGARNSPASRPVLPIVLGVVGAAVACILAVGAFIWVRRRRSSPILSLTNKWLPVGGIFASSVHSPKMTRTASPTSRHDHIVDTDSQHSAHSNSSGNGNGTNNLARRRNSLIDPIATAPASLHAHTATNHHNIAMGRSATGGAPSNTNNNAATFNKMSMYSNGSLMRQERIASVGAGLLFSNRMQLRRSNVTGKIVNQPLGGDGSGSGGAANDSQVTIGDLYPMSPSDNNDIMDILDSLVSPVTPTSASTSGSQPHSSGNGKKRRAPRPYLAIAAFEPALDDELRIQAGDTVLLQKKYEDGWAVGVNVRTGLIGAFPMECLGERVQL